MRVSRVNAEPIPSLFSTQSLFASAYQNGGDQFSRDSFVIEPANYVSDGQRILAASFYGPSVFTKSVYGDMNDFANQISIALSGRGFMPRVPVIRAGYFMEASPMQQLVHAARLIDVCEFLDRKLMRQDLMKDYEYRDLYAQEIQGDDFDLLKPACSFFHLQSHQDRINSKSAITSHKCET